MLHAAADAQATGIAITAPQGGQSENAYSSTVVATCSSKHEGRARSPDGGMEPARWPCYPWNGSGRLRSLDDPSKLGPTYTVTWDPDAGVHVEVMR